MQKRAELKRNSRDEQTVVYIGICPVLRLSYLYAIKKACCIICFGQADSKLL
jgi:hypothetical protein